MDGQTVLEKKTVLSIRPAFPIIPAALELKAEQLVAQKPRADSERQCRAAVDPDAIAHRRWENVMCSRS